MKSGCFWSIVFLVVLCVLPAIAQTQASISGVIHDYTGAVIPGVTVTVTNPATNFTRNAISNEAGVYNFPALQPGRYDIKVELPGFRTITQKDVELQIQQSARIDFTLQVGEVSQTVEVSGTAALIATENATVGTVIENKRIIEMPLNGRNFLQLTSLSPNVSYGFTNSGQEDQRQGGSRASQNIAVAGQRSAFNHFTLDGVENADVNFNTYVILPSIDALQEFKVQTGIFPAEFGRATTQINASTKPGTNQFHGTLFEFLRNDKLDAKQYAFAGERPKDAFKWNQYGFTVGGPVTIPGLYKGTDRLFFMSNFEGFNERRTTRTLYSVPSVKMRGGDFSEILSLTNTRIYDPTTTRPDPGRPGAFLRDPFPGNLITSNKISPISQKLLEFYPAPNLNPNLVPYNYEGTLNRKADKDQFIQRIDFTESSKSSWFGRYSWSGESEATPFFFNGSQVQTHVHQSMVSNTRVLSTSKVNEFRFGFNSFYNLKSGIFANTRDVMSELNIPGISKMPGVAWGTPQITITGFVIAAGGVGTTFGDNSNGPYENRNRVYQAIENFSWTRGTHSFRFGGELRWDQYNQLGNQFPRGSFNFQPNATSNVGAAGTGYGFADFLLGYESQSQGSITLAEIKFRATSQAYYIDDTWKIHPKVSVNYGLRYEYTPPFLDLGGNLVNFYMPFVDTNPNVADLSRHPTLVREGKGDFYEGVSFRFDPAVKAARDGRLGDRLVADDKTNFAPRLGIAWNPNSKWVVRTGGGMFYAQDTGNPRFDMARNLAGRRRDIGTPAIIDLTWNVPFRGLGAGPNGTDLVPQPYGLANIYNRRTPYSIQYLLNVQRELGGNTALEIGYIGSVSRRLESLRAFNEAYPTADPTLSVASRSPYPELGRFQEVDGSGKANYNAFSVKLQRRFSKGLTYLFGYTWSKSIDYGSAIRVHDTDVLFPQSSYNLRAERGLSSFNQDHRAVTSVLYDLPIGKGRRFLGDGGIADAIIGGWQLGSIFTVGSGFPATVIDNRDQSNTGIGYDRPNATGQYPVLPRGVRHPQRRFHTAAFALQPYGSFGTAGRETVITPRSIQFDFSAHKEFRIVENHALQFRFEAFNLPNHPNWGNPDLSFTSQTFGRINSTRTNMREIQVALKYMF